VDNAVVVEALDACSHAFEHLQGNTKGSAQRSDVNGLPSADKAGRQAVGWLERGQQRALEHEQGQGL
jgi:hypothetical protein